MEIEEILKELIDDEVLTVRVDEKLSRASYFYGYDRPPMDNPKVMDASYHVEFVGHITYPEVLTNRICDIEISPINEEYKKKHKNITTIGTLVIAKACKASVKMAENAVTDLLHQYFLFREKDTEHFHISLHIQSFEDSQDRRVFKIYKLNTGWGD